jgi:hypothetical protein
MREEKTITLTPSQLFKVRQIVANFDQLNVGTMAVLLELFRLFTPADDEKAQAGYREFQSDGQLMMQWNNTDSNGAPILWQRALSARQVNILAQVLTNPPAGAAKVLDIIDTINPLLAQLGKPQVGEG